MEQPDRSAPQASDTDTGNTASRRWVAPLRTFTALSVAELTQGSSWPGDDGLGTFTHS